MRWQSVFPTAAKEIVKKDVAFLGGNSDDIVNASWLCLYKADNDITRKGEIIRAWKEIVNYIYESNIYDSDPVAIQYFGRNLDEPKSAIRVEASGATGFANAGDVYIGVGNNAASAANDSGTLRTALVRMIESALEEPFKRRDS